MSLSAVNERWSFLAGKVRLKEMKVRRPRWWEYLLFWRPRKYQVTYTFEVLP